MTQTDAKLFVEILFYQIHYKLPENTKDALIENYIYKPLTAR